MLLAEDDPQTAQNLAERGLNLYRNNDVEGAINYFSRALLLNPHNKIAQNNLIAIASNEQLSAKQKINLFLLEDLISRIKDLTDRNDYLSDKRDLMAEDLITKGYKRQLLDEDLQNIMNYVVNSKEFMLSSTKQDPSLDKNNPLEVVNSSLLNVKEQLSQKMQYLKKQLDHLRDLNKENWYLEKDESLLAKEKKALERREYWDYQNQVASNDAMTIQTGPINVSDGQTTKELSFLEVKDKGVTPEEDISLLKQDLGVLKQQILDLQKNVTEKDQKVSQLSSQIVDFALKLAEKENQLTTKVDDFANINKDFQELQSRFEFGQKIIQDKDNEIKALQDSIQESIPQEEQITAIAGAQNIQDEKINELNGILETYRTKLGNANNELKEKDIKISSLSNDLANLQSKYIENERTIKISDRSTDKKDKELAAVKNAMDRMRYQTDKNNEKLQNIVKEKYAKLKELNGIVEIYKNRLVDTSLQLKEKAANIKILEEQLTLVQTKLFEKDQLIKKTNDSLHSLENQLQDVQNRLTEIKTSKNQSEQNPLVENEVASLKDKIKELNSLIKNELTEFDKINSNLPQVDIENINKLLE